MFTSRPPAYTMVPQNSDSDDEEVVYAASSLEPQQCGSGGEDQFGTGIYNRDLRLKLYPPSHLRDELKVKKLKRQHGLCSTLLCGLLMVTLLGLGISIIVYAQLYLKPGVQVGPPALCTAPPPPLPNNGNGCVNSKPSPATDSISSMVTQDTLPTTIGEEETTRTTDAHRPDLTGHVSSSETTPAPPLVVTEPGETNPARSGSTRQTTLPHQDPRTATPAVSDPTSSLPKEEDPGSHTTVPSSRGVHWRKTFFPSQSECTLQLYDMNRDGVVDVVAVSIYDPCAVNVVAMDGVTGTVVWEAVVKFPVFALRCELDVNLDGVMDCIASGRGGGFTALNGINGSVLWVVDKTIAFPGYNFFFPLLVDDLDHDGVPDLINMHGGDSTYKDEVERSPGYLVAISGRTGGKLMDPILTPDGRETYMSPVPFKVGKFELILFGTGGETVPGSLWAVGMDSLRTRILKYKFSHSSVYSVDTSSLEHSCPPQKDYLDSIRPSFNASAFNFTRPVNSRDASYLKLCPKLNKVRPIWNSYEVCLYEIVRSTFKGVILPPVIMDLNGDESDDLLVSTFDNHIVAYSGLDLTRLWSKYYPGGESYRDRLPDILVRANRGEWADYSWSTLHLLDGKDRSELWSLDSTRSGMMSAISVAADSYGQDAMLFITIGEDKLPDPKVRVRRHGANDPHSKEGKEPVEPDDLWTPRSSADVFPDPVDDLDGFMQYCGFSVPLLSAKVYLVDRPMVERGMDIRPIALETPFVYKGPLVNVKPANFSHEIVKRQTNIIYPSSFTTSLSSAPQSETPPPQLETESQLNIYQEVNDVSDDVTGEAIEDDDVTSEVMEGEDDEHFMLRTRHEFRCSRVLAPIMIATTPTIGDLNGDGRLEVSFSTVWENIEGITTPSQMSVRTFTLEDQFVAEYGEGVIDFQRFLPSGSQPWSRYMGTHGNNVYNPQKSFRHT